MQFMKQRKSEKHDAAAVKLSQHPGYAGALLRASELADELKEHRRELEKLKMQCVRLGEDARHFVINTAIALDASDEELTAMARQLIKGGDVITEVRAARSVGLCANLYSRLNFNDKDDLTFVKELDDYRAAVTVLERCVRLQNAEVLSQKNIAIVEIAKALRPRRERIARQIAEALMALRAALAEEQSFGEELATQDEGFAHQMRPAIFPMLLLSDAEILSWIGEAQAAGLMDPGYQHLETAEDAVEASA